MTARVARGLEGPAGQCCRRSGEGGTNNCLSSLDRTFVQAVSSAEVHKSVGVEEGMRERQ